MNTFAATSQNVKTAACVVLFDAKYLGKFRNRKFGQGIAVKPVEAPTVGKSATDADYRRHIEETTFTAEEFRLAQRNNISLVDARDVIQNFESFCEDRAEMMTDSIDDDDMLESMASEHDSEDEFNRYEEAELSGVGMTAPVVDESDFARHAPARYRHRRVNAAKSRRRLAVAH